MKNNHKHTNLKGMINWIALLMNVVILKAAYLNNPKWYWCLLISAPLLVIAAKRRSYR